MRFESKRNYKIKHRVEKKEIMMNCQKRDEIWNQAKI